tara:strand:- start:4445 stop:4792 length:348 start_codon:yes stop_codon:yes gene_type:complete
MRKQNRTVLNMRSGRMKFKRRIDIPLWHQDHLPKVVNLLRESADRIEKINQSNELRNSDKTLAAQVVITQAQHHASRMSPLDPRERGAELGEYGDQGWVTTHGHEALNRRTDMDD